MTTLTMMHPGKVLEAEFLAPFHITPFQLASDTGIPYYRIHNIIKGEERITADIALRLSKYFDNSARFWLRLRNAYDLEMAAQDSLLDHIPRFRYSAA